MLRGYMRTIMILNNTRTEYKNFQLVYILKALYHWLYDGDLFCANQIKAWGFVRYRRQSYGSGMAYATSDQLVFRSFEFNSSSNLSLFYEYIAYT